MTRVLTLVRHHRPASALVVVAAVILVGTASAFAFSTPVRHSPHRVVLAGRWSSTSLAPVAAATPSSTTTIAPTTTTTAVTTTTPPPPPPPPTTTSAPPAVAARPAPPPAPTGCPVALPAQLASTAGAGQIITVEASGYGVTDATLTAWQKTGSCWTAVDGPWTARLGYTGLKTDKHEGDGSTPAGIFGFQSTIYGNAPDPGVHYSYRQLQCGDWWDEDSVSPTYNTFQEVPCSETNPPFDNGSSEALWTETEAYPSFAVINYNPSRVPGAGSAIFLHADVGGPTDGCVSLPLGELDTVLDWLQPGADPAIVLGTNSTITAY
jgi:L,D-peptidoglycan transpeptidase YkuD (ErfK/YbiS/YcfS/YnhG family)